MTPLPRKKAEIVALLGRPAIKRTFEGIASKTHVERDVLCKMVGVNAKEWVEAGRDNPVLRDGFMHWFHTYLRILREEALKLPRPFGLVIPPENGPGGEGETQVPWTPKSQRLPEQFGIAVVPTHGPVAASVALQKEAKWILNLSRRIERENAKFGPGSALTNGMTREQRAVTRATMLSIETQINAVRLMIDSIINPVVEKMPDVKRLVR